ncbi:MAG: Transglutaminase [Actinomycetia bacterium]|nr:Transglutaminase [Actinomycetes bacterium]
MRVHVGSEFVYETAVPTHSVWQVEPRPDSEHRVLSEAWTITPDVPTHVYRDQFGNVCRRLTMPQGQCFLRYDAEAEVPGHADASDTDASEPRPEQLPDDVLVFTLPSRFCPSDVLADEAWNLFGAMTPGWSRVQAICDWVHAEVQFAYGSSSPVMSAADVFESRSGVCRDYAHLAVTFCRALNIPARYAFGYLPDIAVTPLDDPMDFCAWMEVYLGGRWWTFDPRNNARRIGRVLIGRGRDALDVAMVTTFGAPNLARMTVWADEIEVANAT